MQQEAENMDLFIKVAADAIGELRKVDVMRVLESTWAFIYSDSGQLWVESKFGAIIFCHNWNAENDPTLTLCHPQHALSENLTLVHSPSYLDQYPQRSGYPATSAI